MNRTYIKRCHLYLILLLFVSYFPFLPGVRCKPELLISTLFFFFLFSDNISSYTYVVFIGLLSDLLSHSIIGITSLQNVVIFLLITSNKSALINQKFYIVWIAFLLALIFITAIKVIFYMMIRGADIAIAPIAFQIIVTFLFYPILHLVYYENRKLVGCDKLDAR